MRADNNNFRQSEVAITSTAFGSYFEYSKPEHEVADIFRLYGDEYRQRHSITPEQRRVMNDIERCRTSALGGHVEQCDDCGVKRISYNSCRNRHCPKCQGAQRES
jgi:predicted Zn-ribbon and HTH transcriptional regulator